MISMCDHVSFFWPTASTQQAEGHKTVKGGHNVPFWQRYGFCTRSTNTTCLYSGSFVIGIVQGMRLGNSSNGRYMSVIV
jgi:hypothetical protein